MSKLLPILFLITAVTNLELLAADKPVNQTKSHHMYALAKSKITENSILIGSVAIIAGGCFVGRKHFSGLGWVTKRHFDTKMGELSQSLRGISTDVMQAKSFLYRHIEGLRRLVQDEFRHVNNKLDIQATKAANQEQKLQDIHADIKSLHDKIDQYFKTK